MNSRPADANCVTADVAISVQDKEAGAARDVQRDSIPMRNIGCSMGLRLCDRMRRRLPWTNRAAVSGMRCYSVARMHPIDGGPDQITPQNNY
jgi:hypothetical protein